MLALLTNQYFVALGIPVLLMLCGSIIKKLVRSSTWEKKDFYFGSELTLTALGAALLNLYDIVKTAKDKPLLIKDNLLQLFGVNAGFIMLSLVILLILISLHQDWEARTGNQIGQFLLLTLTCNALGIGVFAFFVLFVKGV